MTAENELKGFYYKVQDYFAEYLDFPPFRRPDSINLLENTEPIDHYNGNVKWQPSRSNQRETVLKIFAEKKWIKPILARECVKSFFAPNMRDHPIILALIYRRLGYGTVPFSKRVQKSINRLYGMIYPSLSKECATEQVLAANLRFLPSRLPEDNIDRPFKVYTRGLGNLQEHFINNDHEFLDFVLDDHFYKLFYDQPFLREELQINLELADIFRKYKIPIPKDRIEDVYDIVHPSRSPSEKQDFLARFHDYFETMQNRGTGYSYKINYRAFGLDVYIVIFWFTPRVKRQYIDGWFSSNKQIWSFKEITSKNTIIRFVYILYHSFDHIFSLCQRLMDAGYLEDFLVFKPDAAHICVNYPKSNIYFGDWKFRDIMKNHTMDLQQIYTPQGLSRGLSSKLDYIDLLLLDMASYSSENGFSLLPRSLANRFTRKITIHINRLLKISSEMDTKEEKKQIENNIKAMRAYTNLSHSEKLEELEARIARLVKSNAMYPVMLSSLYIPFQKYRYVHIKSTKEIESRLTMFLKWIPYCSFHEGYGYRGEKYIGLSIKTNRAVDIVLDNLLDIIFKDHIIFNSSVFGGDLSFGVPFFLPDLILMQDAERKQNLFGLLDNIKEHIPPKPYIDGKSKLHRHFHIKEPDSTAHHPIFYNQLEYAVKDKISPQLWSLFAKENAAKKKQQQFLDRKDTLGDYRTIQGIKGLKGRLHRRVDLTPCWQKFGFDYYIVTVQVIQDTFDTAHVRGINTLAYLCCDGCVKIEANKESHNIKTYTIHYVFPLDDFAHNLYNYAKTRGAVDNVRIYKIVRSHYTASPEFMMTSDGWKATYYALNHMIEHLLEIDGSHGDQSLFGSGKLVVHYISNKKIEVIPEDPLYSYTNGLYGRNVKKIINLTNQENLQGIIDRNLAYFTPDIEPTQIGLPHRIQMVISDISEDLKSTWLEIIGMLPYSIIHEAPNALLAELNLPESRIEQLLFHFLEMKEAMDIPYFIFSDNFATIPIGEATNHRAKSLPSPFESHEWSKYKKKFFRKRYFDENGIPIPPDKRQ